MSHLADDIRVPIKFLRALVSVDACPMCLGDLKRKKVCPECGADLAPVLDLYEDENVDLDGVAGGT